MAGLERFFGKDDFSDVDVVVIEITEDDDDVHPSKRPRTTTLDTAGTAQHAASTAELKRIPGHRLMLSGKSDVFNAQLLNWSNTNASSSDHGTKPEIRLEVPVGQLEAGELLLQLMYQQQPDVANISQLVLLQLLVLADKFAVPSALAAVHSFFASMPAEQLEWDTLYAVYHLPDVVSKSAVAMAGLIQVVKKKLQHELGDLELVWLDGKDADHKQQRLLALRAAALKQLLGDPETRVASENTVAHTVIRWASTNNPNDGQVKELAALVRIPHCSPQYVATVLSQSVLAQCFSSCDLHTATLCSVSSSKATARLQEVQDPIMERHPSWFEAARPMSALQQLVLRLDVPVSELQQLSAGLLRPDADTTQTQVVGDMQTWRGRSLRTVALLNKTTSETSAATVDIELDLYVGVRKLSNALACITGQFALLPFGRNKTMERMASTFVRDGDVRGFTMCTLNNVDPVGIEQALRDKQLVHPDGCLHFEVIVTDVL